MLLVSCIGNLFATKGHTYFLLYFLLMFVAILGPLIYQINFRIMLSVTTNNLAWDYVESIDQI